MSGGKKRSGFQITSVTSDLHQSPAGQSSPSMVLSVLQSDTSSSCSPQGSSSQPTTPSLKRKYVSHDAAGQGAGSSSRFRVVRLAVGGAGGGGRGESYRRGRWTCMEFLERQERAGFRRVMDSMRHAHSLESLEMIGRDRDRGGVHSQDTHPHIHTYTHIYTHIHTHLYKHIYTHTHIYTYTPTHTHTHTHTSTHTHTRYDNDTYIYYMYVCMYVCIYIYIYI
uniref:Zgc:153012 n=1 Tax=Amphiprion percula TaxID=161767 RepID=A0A3P8U3F6_AMPPE